MNKLVTAGVLVLGLGIVTFALAQHGAEQAPSGPIARNTPAVAIPGRSSAERAELHDKVARLRAEVEVLQLEHDLTRERLSVGFKESLEGIEGNPSQQVARDYMRIGAELVGKGPEFESAMQEKGDEIWKAVAKAAGAPSPADLDRLKQDFIRIATELNRKKIDLIELEIHLDASL